MIPKRVSFSLLSRHITVKLDELLFPCIVLVTVLLYYLDTRGLPDQSMIYAGPLLYITTILAVITILQHSIKFGKPSGPLTDGIGEAEGAVVENADEQPSEAENVDEQDEPSDSDSFFTRKNTALFVGVTILYIIGLNFLSSFLTTVTFVGLTAAFLGAVLFLYGERNILALIAYSVVFSVLIWAVFINWLEVPLV